MFCCGFSSVGKTKEHLFYTQKVESSKLSNRIYSFILIYSITCDLLMFLKNLYYYS